jgi:hypothetical protein
MSWPQILIARKKREILRKIQELPRRSVVLAEDETDLLLFPPLRSAWAKRGAPAKVMLSGWNARRVIYGMLNIRTGSRLFLAHTSHKQSAFQEFLKLLHEHYRGWHIAVLLDGNSAHTATGSQNLAKNYRMDFLWLPTRAPELNPLDHLWGQAKDQISSNMQRPTIDDQDARFLNYLQTLSPLETLQKSGVLSANSWLKDVM